ncbi:hypothetical protein LMH78_04700 [Vibrio lentus]|uniref:hypothetical protein n=1 Tax=Vibrio lentus TaxID=136468 RepID=UPI001E422C75|nr:hypothetical protein [Vibrio lentus]MCC4855097.1 hypothetical protein [Vibrio lentus]
MKPEKFNNLGKAILHWLSFQKLCGREMLFSEYYLSQPIGEFLLHHHSGTLASEVLHPNFKKTKDSSENLKGRPRQIDFCLHSRDSGYMKVALELKWVGEFPTNKQKVVDDIFRLELLREEKGHVHRYFLVAGETENFTNNFQNVKSNHQSTRIPFINGFLSFNVGEEVRVVTSELHEPQKAAVLAFGTAYNKSIPARFSTKCIYGESEGGFSVYIWNVISSGKRKEHDLNQYSIS